jgi:alkanesulfonate monooxygenase SsuD/methylene tetrahydromethanopterin reductase-like flavin-dependent oxidoreductase (luciferase family)
MDAVTERDALIGRPDEIIRRIKRLQEGGVEYVMVIDFAGSLDHLRTFAREVMPAFA